MPWCEPCEKWRSPEGLLPDGTCPRCGNQVDHGAVAVDAKERTVARQAAAQEAAKIPWHFWVMVAAAAIYLVWRLIQGLGLLF